MKVLEIQGEFGLDRLRPANRAEPRPGPGQVALRMRAASLNYRDLLTVQGHYNPRQPLPLIPGSDGVGEVVAVGDGVDRVAVGDRVATLFAQGWLAGRPTRDKLRSTLGGPLDGVLCESMVLSQEGVTRVPDHLDDTEAATLPCAGLTAWSALTEGGEVTAGQTVLILGTGGVSLFALQLARLRGARTIVTSSSDERLERAREVGAWQTVNYRETPDWGKAVRTLTDGEGVDRVIEVGGAATLGQSLTALAFGGQISLIGNLGGAKTELNLIPIFMRQCRIQGILVGHRDGFEAMNRAIAAHELRPIVDRVVPLSETGAALAAMAQGGHFGKICVRISEDDTP